MRRELSAAVLVRRSTAVLETVIGAVHKPEANRLRCTLLGRVHFGGPCVAGFVG
jgi:hypothetical protein